MGGDIVHIYTVVTTYILLLSGFGVRHLNIYKLSDIFFKCDFRNLVYSLYYNTKKNLMTKSFVVRRAERQKTGYEYDKVCWSRPKPMQEICSSLLRCFRKQIFNKKSRLQKICRGMRAIRYLLLHYEWNANRKSDRKKIEEAS